MSTLPRLLRALSAEPLVIERRTLDAFLSVLRRRAIAGESFNGLALHAELDIDEPRPATETETGDRTVAVIPIVGVIANRVQSLGAGTDEIGERLARAVQSRKVDAIVLDVDSPGGTITGVPELAEKVFQARKVKPVVAVANGLMASAAYWIGAAAEEVVASPSSSVGSIGVFMIHEDLSGLLEKEGVVVTEFSAGRFKTEGAPWKPLSEEAEAFFQGRVQKAYDWFVRDVARFRDDTAAKVRNGYGEGRVLDAAAAVEAGLADRVASIDEVIRDLIGGERRRSQAPSSGAANANHGGPMAEGTQGAPAATDRPQITLEYLEAHHADLVAQIRTASATKERDRIIGISKLPAQGLEQLRAECMADPECSSGRAAERILAARGEAEGRRQQAHLDALAAGERQVEQVTSAPGGAATGGEATADQIAAGILATHNRLRGRTAS